MSSVDQLQIQITASSQDATRAINSLISSLQNLNKQLGLKDGTRFAQTLNSMAKAMDTFTGKLNSVNADAFSGVAKGAQNIGREAEVASAKVKKLADNLDLVTESMQMQNQLGGANYSKKIIPGQAASKGDIEPKEFGFTSDIPTLTATQRLIEDINSSLSDFKTPDLDTYFRRTAEAAREADENIEECRKQMAELEGMPSPELPQLLDALTQQPSNDLGETLSAFDRIKKSLSGIKQEAPNVLKQAFGGETLLNLIALGEGLEHLSHKLHEAAENGKKFFGILVTPLKLAAGEYVEKFEHMKNAVSKFAANVKSSLTKLSAFWKRIMRTFTFMLVRKAITAIIKEVNNAIQSLAMFSNAMGTQFNQSMSTLVADFQYLGRSIVSVFAPLIDYIAPIIDAIIDKIATLLSYIGMLFAALGGSSSFTKAKKNVGNYAESLDDASKKAKNLTMGIDELNILNDKSGGSSKPYDGWEDAWEEVDIPDWLKGLADKLKKFWEDFLEPIKKAWEKVKAYFKFAFEYMKEQVLLLAESIYKAFMEVWKQDATVEMLANILRIVADLMIVVGNLAKRFREAWDEAERGVRIFEGIRDVIAILVEHLRNVTWYMVRWSDSLDFRPLLDSVIGLLDAFKELADFIGGVFEDVMKNVVLKYIKWMIEDAIPHLNHVIAEVIEAFDFSKIREDLLPLEEAFERLMENIHTGVTNAMGNLGEKIAEFTNSQAFTDFLQRLADIMDLISAEDVEKILTGIGEGILAIAEAVVKFVNSDIFMGFLQTIDDWLADTSSSDIAGILTGIAIAIGLFDFAAFLTGGVAEFLKFFAIIKAAGALAPTLAAQKIFGTISMMVVGAISAIVAFFKMWKDGWSVAMEVVKDVGIALVAIGAIILGVTAAPALIVAAVVAALSTIIILIHEHWDEIKAFFTETIPAWWNDTALPWLQALPEKIGEFFGNLWDTIKTWASDKITAIGAWLEKVKIQVLLKIGHLIVSIVRFFDELPEKIGYALGFVIGKFVEWCGSVVSWVTENVPIIIENIVTFFTQLPEKIGLWLLETLVHFFQWKAEVETWIAEHVAHFIESIVTFFQELPGKIYEKLEEVVAKFNEWKDSITEWIATEIPKIIESFVGFFKEIPQKLHDLGEDIINGLLNGIKEAWDRLKGGVGDFCDNFLQGFREALKINSPSKEMEEIGDYSVEGLFVPFTENQTSKINAFTSAFIDAMRTGLSPDKFTEIGNQIIELGIMPFFSVEKWQPLFDNLLNMVFIPAFELFKAWFNDEAMTVWWEEYLLPWFGEDKWNKDIFEPLMEIIQDHWNKFSDWWDTTILEWWENQIKPWFEQELWEEQFNHILEAAKAVFDEIVEAIKKRMDMAVEAVSEACESMSNSLQEVLSLIEEIINKVNSLNGMSVNLNVGEFASGGFPRGDLFIANEAGPELVGTIGGKTAVASNGELIQFNHGSLGGVKGFEILQDADIESFGRKIGEKATELLDAKPAPSGRFTIVADNNLTGVFIHEAVGHAVEADLVLQDDSILLIL